MPLQYDATLKDLAQVNPRGVLAYFDAPTTLPVSLLNVDLSTVTTSADLVFGLGEPLREIVHMDFQSSASATKHLDIPVYNTLIHREYKVPVHSIVVLLRPQAVHPNLTGVVAYAPRPERGKMDSQYEIIRLWEQPVDDLLAGDIATVPLAVLAELPAKANLETELGGVIEQVIKRLENEAGPETVRRLITASFVLTGLRVKRQIALDLFQGVRAMRDSDTYMYILEEGHKKGFKKGLKKGHEKGREEGREQGREEGREEGRIDELRKLILRLGQKRFGRTSKSVAATIESIADLARLEMLAGRLLDVMSWQELLAKR